MRSNINKYSFGSVPSNLYWITWARMLDLLDPWALGCMNMAPVTPHGPFLFLSLSSHLYKHLNSPNPKLFPSPRRHHLVVHYPFTFFLSTTSTQIAPAFAYFPCLSRLSLLALCYPSLFELLHLYLESPRYHRESYYFRARGKGIPYT